MAKEYTQLTLMQRQRIQEGLDACESFRAIAKGISRSASTVSREVHANRVPKTEKSKKKQVECRDRNWCARTCICDKSCTRQGARCAGCDVVDCRTICRSYADQESCERVTRAPWVCNGCRKLRYGCRRSCRWIYSAKAAQQLSEERRSESRMGIDMPRDKAEKSLAVIKDAIGRGMSPYEVSAAYCDVVGISQSTIYRWVERGYAGMANLDLERKVGFKPRNRTPARKKTTSHSPKRAYSRFEALSEEEKACAFEMDTVIGRNIDNQCVLTLYPRAPHFQFALIAASKTPEAIKEALLTLKDVCDPKLFKALFHLGLTDNGTEFADESALGAVFGEAAFRRGGVHLYYCDVRQSQQKAGCEKNHSEIRQILKKGRFVFDELNGRDMAVLMSHANSNPRASLNGLSPIRVLLNAYGEAAGDLLAAFGVHEVPRDELFLRPEILDIERAKRGEAPLTHLK